MPDQPTPSPTAQQLAVAREIYRRFMPLMHDDSVPGIATILAKHDGELRRAIESMRAAVKKLYDDAEAAGMDVSAGCYARAFAEMNKAYFTTLIPKGPTP